MNQYIITEEQLQRLVMDKDSVTFAIENVVYEVRSRLVSSQQSGRGEVLDEVLIKLSKLQTKEKWMDEYVWWKVIEVAIKELHTKGGE